jgi:hypothetical protein
MPKDLAVEYRKWADECRRQAETCTDGIERARWLKFANKWQRLLRQSYQSTKPPGPGYHVVVTERGPSSWEWEICRDGQPLPVPLRDGFYKSKTTAGAAGRVAIREFLEALDREQNA